MPYYVKYDGLWTRVEYGQPDNAQFYETFQEAKNVANEYVFYHRQRVDELLERQFHKE